jgi:hypothetical protein
MVSRSIFPLITLAGLTLSCSIFIGGPVYPIASIPVPTNKQQSLQSAVEKAISDSSQTGIVTLQISENQLTSYLTSKLETQTNPIISEPQVFLREGQIKIFGKAASGIFIANVSVTAKIMVDTDGQPEINITQTDLGPLPTPQGVNNAISALVHEAFMGSLGPIATGFRLESISIADGLMTVKGRIK